MHLTLPEVALLDGSARVSATLTVDGSDKTLWFSVRAENAGWLTVDKSDGFLVAILLYAMGRGEDIELRGPVSSRLFHSIRDFVIPMIARAFPHKRIIAIRPGTLTEERASGQAVGTGFSGGIDSFSTLAKHYVNESAVSHRITHLLFNNIGSHGTARTDYARRLFQSRYDALSPFTREVGLPFVQVDSNLPDIIDIDFITDHTFLNCAIPLLMQNYFRRFYYSSTFRYSDCAVTGTDDIAHFDPFLVHLFSTESVECVSTGCEMSRVEKTDLVSKYEPSYRFLDVCADPHPDGLNCSVCFKCARTMFTLETLGVLDAYHQVFDLKKFAGARTKYALGLLGPRASAFDREVAELYIATKRDMFSRALKIRYAI